MELFRAGEQDFLRLQAFYKNLIAKTPDMRQFCPWEYGVYPTDALLREHIDNGDLYYMERNGVILAALVLLPYQEENYTWDNPWGAALEDDQVATVHMLGVNPEMQGQGIALPVGGGSHPESQGNGEKSGASGCTFLQSSGAKAISLYGLCRSRHRPLAIRQFGLDGFCAV